MLQMASVKGLCCVNSPSVDVNLIESGEMRLTCFNVSFSGVARAVGTTLGEVHRGDKTTTA